MVHRTKRAVDEPRSADIIPGPHLSQIGADPVGLLVPGAGPAELRLRRRLLNAQALSGSRLALLRSNHGRRLNEILLEAAMAWAYAPATVDQLTEVVNLCLRLAMAVSAAERLDEELKR